MMPIWIAAWCISTVISAGAWICAYRGGLRRWECLAIAAGFFPAPLFVAIGGSNSFVYAFDLVVPLTLFLAAQCWPQVPGTAKTSALLLGVGAGLIPFLVYLVLADRQCVMYAAISLYRLVGAMALMCFLSAQARNLTDQGASLMGAFSWMNVVLLVATLMQSKGWIDSNVFYNVVDGSSPEDSESLRFITAGLFRGSLGIIGSLGWMAFLASHNARGARGILAFAGGVSGALVIILCGSKTSLLTVLFITLAAGILFPDTLRRLWRRMAVMLLGLSLISGLHLLRLDTDYFSYTLGVLGMADESLGTFSYRQDRWQEAVKFIARQPTVLLGVSTPNDQENYALGLGYFHNEYISLLMGGGIWSTAPYLLALFVISRSVFRRARTASSGQIFAALAVISGVAQALTVNHLVPGLFFGCTVTISASAYALGFASVAGPTAACMEMAESEAAPGFSQTSGVT